MALAECSRFHGNATLIAEDPACETFETILYTPVPLPHAADRRSFGLYGRDGALIPAAAKRLGPGGQNAGPAAAIAVAPEDFHRTYDGDLFYIGWVSWHYGHFLIDTLCRMWAWQRCQDRPVKILYHGHAAPERLLDTPFAAAIFSALGLGPAHFIKFDTPTLLRRVIIPCPAIEELNFSHRIYGQFLNRLGDIISPDTGAPANADPLYLTKAKVKSGVSHYVNEDELVDHLARRGVEIIAPEALSLPEQISLFRNRTTITGLIGSAQHTSAFVPRRKTLFLNYIPTLWTNYRLFDIANQNRTIYVHDLEESPNEGPTAQFGNNFRIPNPRRLADDLLRRIEFFMIENRLGV